MSNRISLTVETTTGAYSVAFGPNHYIGAVLGEVLSRMGVKRAWDEYQLVHAQDPVPATITVGQSPLSDGDTVFLESNPAGGI